MDETSSAAKEKGLDSSQLLPPMNTSRRGLQQVLDLFRHATPNLKQLLLQEADIIYECRVCKNLFRGLINFIEHKRSYCKLQSGLDHHLATKAVGLNLRDLYPNEDAAAPQVDPQPPTSSPVNERGIPKRSVAEPIVINDQSAEVGNSDAYLILRPIPATTEAIEQQVVRSDHIVHHDELEKLSIFTPKPEGEETAKIVGEIAIRQAAKGSQTNRVEKREALHNLLKNVGGKAGSENGEMDGISNSMEVVNQVGREGEVGGKMGSSSKAVRVISLQSSHPAEAKEKSPQGTAACQPTECQICKKKCKNWTALAWHMRIHKRPIFKCSLCQYSSTSVYNLRRHMQTMHHLPTSRIDQLLSRKVEQHKVLHEGREKEDTKEGESSNVPTCDICFKTFASRRNVLRHKKIHRQEQQSADISCSGSVTPSKEEIARSKVLQIMDEKNLKCRRCHKQLSTMRRLQQHCCNHFGFNRYRCKLCPYENNDYTQMRRHMMGKHGRQFRTIHQISEAIRNMKIGIWVNLVQNGSGSSNEDNVFPSPVKEVNDSRMTPIKIRPDMPMTPKKDRESRMEVNEEDVAADDDADMLDESGDQKDEEDSGEENEEEDVANDDEEEQSEEDDVEEDQEMNEQESNKFDNKSVKSQSNKENKAVPKTPTKQQQVSNSSNKDVQLTPPSSNGVRKSPDPTPSRDMPIRQARLNHQSVSPRSQSEKTHGDRPATDRLHQVRRDLTKMGSERPRGRSEMDDEDKNTLDLMMDKRMIRCLNCNKQYQYLSSLQRHVRIHLLRGETETHRSPSKSAVDSSKKQQAIEAYINSNLLKCLKCRKRFESMGSLKRHVARHLGYSSFKCKYCGYLSRNYTWFKQHLKMKHADSIRDLNQMGNLIGSMKTKK